MTFAAPVLRALKKIAWTLSAALFMVLVLFVQPLEWLLSVLFVILCLVSLVSSLSVWAPIGCFAVMLGLHLFIMFYPYAELERRLGMSEETATRPRPRPRVRIGRRDSQHRSHLH